MPALKNGAYDYVNKPLDPDEIAHLVAKAISHRRTQQENARLKETVAEIAHPSDIVGQSAAMKRVFDAIETVAASDATVLFTGESGTGKELVARAIHAGRRAVCWRSSTAGRSPRRFSRASCSVTSAARSPARNRRRGASSSPRAARCFSTRSATSACDAGQAAARAAGGRFQLGGNDTIEVDVRVVAATNQDLQQLIADGQFREDLFYRLNVVPISLPPLRQRPGDVPLLVAHFVRKLSREMNKKIARGFTRRR